MNKITISLIFIGSLMFSQAQSPSNDSINDFNKFFSVKLGLNLINSIGEHEPFAFLNDFDEMTFNNNPNAELEYRFSRAFSLGLMVSINTWEANALKPKVIFLDIVMGDGTGFDVIERLSYNDYLVVFITAFQEYAISAFKFNAIDFLLKPIDPVDLMRTLAKIEESIKNEHFTTPSQLKSAKSSIASKTTDYNFIAIPSTKKIDFVRIDNILYLESDGRYTTIHLVDKSTLFVSKNIGEYEKILSTSYFFRIHKT